MRFSFLFTLFVVSIMVLSCTPKQDEVQLRKDEVIAIHDEVMPKMGELKSYEKALTDKAVMLEENGASASEITAFKEAAEACDAAYEGMFVWMRQFNANLTSMEEHEALAYLEDQVGKVKEVNQDIKEALATASSLLEEE